MTFNDIFKSSFLENVSAVSLFDMALALVLAFMEIRLKSDNTDFINTLAEMQGVGSAVLVSCHGDYIG